MKPDTPNGATILNTAKGDMCYCPGCTHGVILEALGRSLDHLALDPRNVCIVSDIGCIGTADKYFNCHTFHGLHGRSLTYAEGVLRFRPEMTVIVLIGDGGCGIGTAHLVHSARRGVGIKVIVCNNFNFGMTGGQHSPTTPPNTQTMTTPFGATERPFDICGTVIANGAAHVGRYSALDGSCQEHIEALLSAPGFGLLDLWELCVAYFVPENKLKPAGLAEFSQRLKLPFGLLHSDLERAASSGFVPSIRAADESRESITVPSLPWLGRVEICVAGSAGQRIRSAAGVIGELAVSAGLFAAQLDDFPITVRKGHSISYLVIDKSPVRYAGVDSPDLVVVLSSEGVNRLEGLDYLKPEALIVADQNVHLPPTAAVVRRIDFAALEKRAGKASAALAALVHGLTQAGHVDVGTLNSIGERALRGKYREQNLCAFREGAALAAPDSKILSLTNLICQEKPP